MSHGFNPTGFPRVNDAGYYIEMYDGAGRESYVPVWHPSRQMLRLVDLAAEAAEVEEEQEGIREREAVIGLRVHSGNPWRWRYN